MNLHILPKKPPGLVKGKDIFPQKGTGPRNRGAKFCRLIHGIAQNGRTTAPGFWEKEVIEKASSLLSFKESFLKAKKKVSWEKMRDTV